MSNKKIMLQVESALLPEPMLDAAPRTKSTTASSSSSSRPHGHGTEQFGMVTSHRHNVREHMKSSHDYQKSHAKIHETKKANTHYNKTAHQLDLLTPPTFEDWIQFSQPHYHEVERTIKKPAPEPIRKKKEPAKKAAAPPRSKLSPMLPPLTPRESFADSDEVPSMISQEEGRGARYGACTAIFEGDSSSCVIS